MPVVVLAAIEIVDLQSLVVRYGCKSLKAESDPVGAAENVCKSILAAEMSGVSVPLPGCHTLSQNPVGWSSKSSECAACFDKITCIVSLHRINKDRPHIQWREKIIEPIGRELASAIIPLTPPLSMVVAKDMSDLSKPQVVAKANMLGIDVGKRDSKAKIIEAIEVAEQEDEDANIKTEFLIPQIDVTKKPPSTSVKTILAMTIEDLQDGDTLWSKRFKNTSRTVSCKVRRNGNVLRWEVAGKTHKNIHDAAKHAYELINGKQPQRINPLRFWGVAGEYKKRDTK